MGLCTSQLTAENAYKPSKFTLKMFMPQVTEYDAKYRAEKPKYSGDKKILICGTHERFLEMKNGKLFDTGHHPIETFLPMLYLRDAGFEFEFATPTGEPLHFEMWAFPNKDENMKGIYDALRPAMDKPMKISDVDTSLSKYAAVFLPGGHGAMHLATCNELGALLRSAHAKDITTLTLCHGPATLLSAALDIPESEYPYKGYKIHCFPDSVDDFTPTVGYMPGLMMNPVCGSLIAKGIEIMNTKDDDKVITHAELISGSSPKASNNLGKIGSDALVKKFC